MSSIGQKVQTSIMQSSSKSYEKNENEKNKKFVIRHSVKQKKVMIQMRKQIIVNNKILRKQKSELRKQKKEMKMKELMNKKKLSNMRKELTRLNKIRKPRKTVRKQINTCETVMKKEMERRARFDIKFQSKFEIKDLSEFVKNLTY